MEIHTSGALCDEMAPYTGKTTMRRRLQFILAVILFGRPLPAQSTLPGSSPLTEGGDQAVEMVDGINRSLLRATEESIEKRARLWNRDFGSAEAYTRSVTPNRERFRKIIGAVDDRVPVTALQLIATTAVGAQIGTGDGYRIFAVRWPVFDDVAAEGLLLQPQNPPIARVVAIPDADWSPEMLVGLSPGVAAQAQFARRLAENGFEVLIPVLIDRTDTWSGIKVIGGNPPVRLTNDPHREWIYKMAFEAGRHIIGYEVQKVLAAVDWFTHENAARPVPIAVMGYGEGGLLAFYSAALDARIQAVLVSGYFQSRQDLWQEPIYRDVWGLLREFGDAEIASLIAPRSLIVEASRGPEVAVPPPRTQDRTGATPNGRLVSPPIDSVKREVELARPFFAKLQTGSHLQLAVSGDGEGPPGSDPALGALLRAVAAGRSLRPSGRPPVDGRSGFDPSARLHDQFDKLVAHTQRVIRESPGRRAMFWAKADSSSPERWKESTKYYRDYIWEEVIGRLPAPNLNANPRTRLIYDEPKYRGYEVKLDVWPDVFAYGILLVPKDIKPGERRPVVVCQHGLEGRPKDVADPNVDSAYYHRFAVRLAEEGFVTFAPQNPYFGEDRFRIIQRKGHPLKLALFSYTIGQHQQLLDWLSSQPFVDPARIGFYGLSYGGKTAMRVPPLLDGYALSICSGDFNEWVWKTTNIEAAESYLLTREYDMYEFDLANIANYAELAKLMAPRPFMVERGHRDTVGLDEWVAFEFAKVRLFYETQLGIAGNADIEFFDGPHTINGKGTFEFLRRHLRWPQ
jgi:dienelactone hydrolase